MVWEDIPGRVYSIAAFVIVFVLTFIGALIASCIKLWTARCKPTTAENGAANTTAQSGPYNTVQSRPYNTVQSGPYNTVQSGPYNTVQSGPYNTVQSGAVVNTVYRQSTGAEKALHFDNLANTHYFFISQFILSLFLKYLTTL